MSFTFDLATPDDDAALRQLLADNPMPGHIRISYQRAPNYFAGCGTMGHSWQIIVGRQQPTGEVTGLACRATRPLFVNGKEQQIGYLGQLRIDKDFRGRWILPRAFRYLYTLHNDGHVPAYLSTIIEDNRIAQGLLVEKPRRHYPAFREVVPLHTVAILLRRAWCPLAHISKHLKPAPTLVISRGSEAILSDIVAFMRQDGKRKQFFPAYRETDFASDSPLTRDFRVEDFVIAKKDGKIVGIMGLWDQSAYKQSVVEGYSRGLKRLRSLINTFTVLIRAQPLPAPNEPIRFAYASFICIADNNPVIFRLLLHHLYHIASQRGYAFLMVGLAATDPLLAVAQRYLHLTYHSRLYTVCWQDGADFHQKLDGRIPYIELAAL